jgi:hypothetical protein
VEDFKFPNICMTASKKHHAQQTPHEPRVAMLILRIIGCRKNCFGLDPCRARLYTATLRHVVLVMAALAICAGAAAPLKGRTDTQAPPPAAPACASRTLAELATPPPGPLPLVASAHPPEPRQRPGQLVTGGCRTSGMLALPGIDAGPPAQIICKPMESVAGLGGRGPAAAHPEVSVFVSRSMSFPRTRESWCSGRPTARASS